MIKEIWKDIPGYDNLYQVSNLGEVKSLGNGNSNCCKVRILKQSTNRYGYKKTSLCKFGKQKGFSIHRLVMLAFVGESDLECNHKDGNPLNNKLENLEYCTRSENIQHRYKVLGRYTRKGKSNIKNNHNKFNGIVYI